MDRFKPVKKPTIPDKITVTLEVPDGKNLDALIGSLAGAINRHADAVAPPETSLAEALNNIGEGLQAIALALSTKEDNSAQILEFASRIKTQREKLKQSVDNQTKGE